MSCPVCGGTVVVHNMGAPKRYCSSRCQLTAWRARNPGYEYGPNLAERFEADLMAAVANGERVRARNRLRTVDEILSAAGGDVGS